jgi:hypothetical protein
MRDTDMWQMVRAYGRHADPPPHSGAAAQGPDLLGGVVARPGPGDGEPVLRFVTRCEKLVVLQNVEADRIEQRHPARDRAAELDPAGVDLHLAPIGAGEVTVGPVQEPVSHGAPFQRRGHQSVIGMIAQKHQRAAGPEQAVRFGQPEVRVRTRSRHHIPKSRNRRMASGRPVASAFPSRNAMSSACSARSRSRRRKLPGGNVDTRNPGPAPCHPGGDIARATAQLDRGHAAHVFRQEVAVPHSVRSSCPNVT